VSSEASFALAIGVVALLIVVLNDRSKQKAARRAEQKGRKPPQRYLNNKTSWWLVLALLIFCPVVIVFAYCSSLLGVSHWVAIVFTTFAVAVLARVAFLYLVVVRKLRVLNRATRLAQAGDVEGAIALSKEHMRRHGPTVFLYNNLAAYHGLQDEWSEALAMIEQAEQMGDAEPFLLGSKGMALWKLGRTDEALSSFEEACRRAPNDLGIACNYGSLLVEVGRLPEALELLRTADDLFADQRNRSAASHQVFEQALEEFRRKATGDSNQN